MWTRILWVLFVAYVVATAIHIGFVVAHEPFSADAWNVAVDTQAQPPTVGRFFAYWQDQYAHSNPRLGQALTYLAYKVEWFAVLATPLAYLALTLAITVLALGRWPKRGREVALWAIVIGFGWFAFPQIGRNMFCSAFAANYVYGAAIQLWFLAWLRLGLAKGSGATTIEYAMFGLVAGVCNEHTGPALVAFLVGLAWWLRREGRSPRLPIAGGIGAAIGVAALLLAPGQAERYDGLAQRAGMLQRVAERGADNLDIFGDYVTYAAPLLGLLLVVWLVPTNDEHRARRRRALQLVVLVIAAGLAIVATVCASPKLGSRFYLVPLALLLVGFLASIELIVPSRWLAPFVALGIVASSYAAIRTIPLYVTMAEQGRARIAVLEAAEPRSVVIVDPWDQFDESWWSIGDDFRGVRKRELVARYFDLDRVSLRGGEVRTSLAALGVRVSARYWLVGSKTPRTDTIDLGLTKSADLPEIHRVTRASIERLRERIAPATLDSYELVAELVGGPSLPRRTVLLSRWRGGRFEGYSDRPGEPFQIYLVQLGSAAKQLGDGEPMPAGPSWVLACDATQCLIIAARG